MNFKQDKDYVLRTIPPPSRDNDPPLILVPSTQLGGNPYPVRGGARLYWV